MVPKFILSLYFSLLVTLISAEVNKRDGFTPIQIDFSIERFGASKLAELAGQTLAKYSRFANKPHHHIGSDKLYFDNHDSDNSSTTIVAPPFFAAATALPAPNKDLDISGWVSSVSASWASEISNALGDFSSKDTVTLSSSSHSHSSGSTSTVAPTGSSSSSTASSSTASASGISLTLENEYSMYIATISLGTPGQSIQVDVDTGSSDLWVPAVGTDAGSYGTYNSNSSSSYEFVSSGFSIKYGDDSYAKGNWVKDTLTLGSSSITSIQFGDATDQDAGQGILGIGLNTNTAASSPYDNFPIMLKKEGYIKTNSYSLYLNSLDATSGSILFGAIDNAKYSGDMATLSLVNIDDGGNATDEPVAFFVELESISAGSKTFTSTQYPALLDSGTTLIYAPSSIAEAVGSKYGTYTSSVGGYVTSCTATGDDFKFEFNGVTITVPFSDLLFEVSSDGEQCLVGVMENDADFYILGDVFLRSAYVVYNLDAHTIGLAQVEYTTDSDISII